MVPFYSIVYKLFRERINLGFGSMHAETTHHENLLMGTSGSQSTCPVVWIFLRENDHNATTEGRNATINSWFIPLFIKFSGKD